MDKQKLVLIGNGMAGIRCIEEILENDAELFTITVFGSEPHVNYNRILLSTVLQGDTSLEDITINNILFEKKSLFVIGEVFLFQKNPLTRGVKG